MSDFAQIRHRMNATGIGFAGVEGAWWLPAAEPFALPTAVAQDLAQIGQAIFVLFDVVTALYGTADGAACGLNQLLTHKVPPQIPQWMSGGQVASVRPDFQLCLQPSAGAGARYQLVATELEICPSAHGFAHAMQVGYGLPTDLVEIFARYLAGRQLIFVGTHQWSEFLFEQLAFCRALEQVGACGRVLYDLPIATLAASVRKGERWQPPMFGLKTKPAQWNENVIQRIHDLGLQPYLWPADEAWPQAVGDAVLFRFGYFDCFSQEKLQYFRQWQARGATLLNPTMFILDSKVIMATLQLPQVRQRIATLDATGLALLDQCIPATLLLQKEKLAQLMDEQAQWVLKFAGFDQGNQAWGGRSLQIGAQQSAATWQQILQQYISLPWPVVAQRIAPSAQVDIAYGDAQGDLHWMKQGTTRLRAFMVRDPAAPSNHPGQALVGGAHITVSGGTMQVSESSDAVQAPVIFG